MKRWRWLLVVFCLLVPVFVVPIGATDTISAQAYIVMDAASGEVFAAKSADLRLPCASTTKIMTALVALERLPLDRKVTITAEQTQIEGSKMYLRTGETVTVSDLLYGLLLASGNDAAVALAEAACGSVEAFVVCMNAKAAELGLTNTLFQNPSGLPDENHYSSARDLAVLMNQTMENEAFAQICGTREAVLTGRTVVNHNRLLHTCEGVDGGKTGYTKSAGRCLVSTAIRNGRRLIAVTLNAPDDWADHRALYETAFDRFRDVELSVAFPNVCLPVVGGEEALVSIFPDGASVMLTEEEEAVLELCIYLPRFCYAPIAFGDQLGYAEWTVGDRVVATVPLRAGARVEIPAAAYY